MTVDEAIGAALQEMLASEQPEHEVQRGEIRRLAERFWMDEQTTVH